MLQCPRHSSYIQNRIGNRLFFLCYCELNSIGNRLCYCGESLGLRFDCTRLSLPSRDGGGGRGLECSWRSHQLQYSHHFWIHLSLKLIAGPRAVMFGRGATKPTLLVILWTRGGRGGGGGEKGAHRRKTWQHAAVIILVPRPCQAFCHLQYRKAVFARGKSMGMRLLQSLWIATVQRSTWSLDQPNIDYLNSIWFWLQTLSWRYVCDFPLWIMGKNVLRIK